MESNEGTSTSPRRNERAEDSEAASSPNNSSFDDDGDDGELSESGPSRKNSQWDSSPFGDFSQPVELDETSCTQQEEEESVLSSEEHGWDEDFRPRKPTPKLTDPSFTSKNYCYVCGKGFSKISRHLLIHADIEPEIAEASALPLNSKERKRVFDTFRNRGNYKHNQEVLKNNHGALKLRRRPTNAHASASSHVHCLYCKGMLQRKEIWRHVAKCPFKPNSDKDGTTRVLTEIALAESPYCQKLPSGVLKLLLSMKQDETAFAVQNDFLLIQLARSLCDRYLNETNKHEFIRKRLREMGRLLIRLQEESINSFEDAIKPKNFYKVIETVRDIAGFHEMTQRYRTPSLAVKMGYSLKKIGSIILSGTDVTEQVKRDTKTFMKLCSKEWSEIICHTAVPCGPKVKNPSTIPFTRDMQVFYNYLEATSASAIENMKTDESQEVYTALCRVTLAQASVLNKCAPEVSKMTLKTFQERDDTTKVLSKNFMRINILSSRTGENIAILLTSELVSAMTLLVTKREACGVNKDNPFLFAKPNSPTSHYHGGHCIRPFSRLCCAKNPAHLRSVHHHKHVARVFQILNLENDELRHLAKLLGHEIRPDREYYRLPEAALELAKIAKLLLAMEKGSLERFKGNTLEEIEIEDELEPDGEQYDSENSDAEEDEEESDLQQSDVVEQQAVKKKQKRQLTPEQDAEEHIKAGRDKPFLEEMFIDHLKGRGVFTRESIEPSTFVVEYRGNLLLNKESGKSKWGDTLKNYLYDFSWDGKNWRIDASNEDGTLGRLVNDDHKSPNCKMKKIVYKGKPHLCLFAVKKISADEEITYNYGNTSYPWHSKESGRSQMNQNYAASSSDNESFEDAAASSAESCSDDEYKPDRDPSSDESCTSTYTPPRKRSKKDPDSDSSKRRRFEQRPTNASFTQQEHKSDHSSDDDCSSDGDDVEFKDPTHTNRNYCYVCGKAMIKLSRHLFTHKKEEPDIAEAFALAPGSKKRFALLEKLRNKGNLKHNEEVIKTNRGELKVKRKRSNQFTGIQTFAQCLYCKGMYSRQVMWRHMQKCTLKKTKETKCKKQRTSKVLTLVAAAESTDLMSSQVMNLDEIIKKLKNDEIASVVKNDTHILQLAQCLYHVNKGKKMQENITSRLKLLGRLMLILQKKSISSFEDALKPQNFSHIVDAVKELAGFNEELKTYHTPTLMMKLMTSLKTIAEIKYARALKESADKQIIREAETFMKLCDKEWRRARPSKSKLSASTVPFIQDVQLLCQYMESTASSAVESLTMYECAPVYIALLRVTVAQLSILNKNMMEVSKVTVKSFNERDNTEHHGDTAEPQPQLEQILSKHYVKLKLVCNKGKEVVAIMTPQLISALTLLVSKRESCGVHANNPFLFGRPSASCSSFFYGHQCMGTCVARCGAKNTTNLRSAFFHQHIERVFQILSLSDDELSQLAKLLGRNIRTDREYYQTPAAALDIAKVSEILSAMENGTLERLEGKSLEEIEVPDILEPDGQPNVEPNEVSDAEPNEDQENPENCDAELSELSLQLSGLFSFSTPKKPNRVSSSRKRGKSKTRKQESEAEPSELNDERNDVVNSEQDDDEMPESCDVDTPEKTMETTEDASKMWFSDDDDDMNVDFDIDTDDDVRNEDNDGDSDTCRSAPIPWIPVEQDTTKHDNDSSDTKKTDSPPNMDTAVSDHEESKDVDEVNNVEEKDQKSRSSSAISNTEKKKKLLAAMKEVKILVKRLDIGTLRFPVHVSKLSSVCNSDNEKKKSKQLYVKDQTVHDDCNKSPTPSTSTELKDKPSSAKEVQMICSHCKKSMLKGQTAYQKKGFPDVFCSKNCLFALFPLNKPVTKTCHYCHQAISQPLDLIMAAVDIKGTMKEFCGINCLCAFKYNTVPTQPTQTICRTCKKTCTTTCELTLYNVLHKFCSDSCLQDFRRENVVTCANCTSTCLHKPLTLKLEGEETKTICSDECLDEFKEKITTPHKCHLCHAPRPVSEMVHYKSEENVVELFCNRYCVSSYKTYLGCKVQDNKSSDQSKEGKRDEQSSEDGKIASDSTVNQNDAESEEPLIVFAKSDVKCRQCSKELQSGQRLYQPKSSQEVFCSASCLSERHPHLKLVQKKCHNCFQVIMRPHDMILAPVDDSGTMKELCGNACLASVNSKRNLSLAKTTGPRSECRMCGRFSWCRFRLILDGLKYRLCSDTCYIRYHKVNNMPVFKCNICSSICHETRLVLKAEDGSKTVCSEECLVKLKKKIEETQLCPMCQTFHQMSDMVESKNEEGKLEFFCSNRCMMVHKAQSVTAPSTGRNSPTLDEIDIKEVKPSLPNLDCIKQEPIEEECNQNLSSSIPTENIKDEPNVAKEDLKIGSVFSLKGEPKSTALTQDLPASCSNCKNVLMDGETVYQRKGRADIFCSTSCLLKFYQMKQAMKTCHFCLQVITQLQDIIQAPVDKEETMKDFCSETCLTSFNYKKIVSTKIPVAPVGSQSQCTICSRYRISKHEIIQQDVVHKICSNPCFVRFCNVNKLSICEICCSHCSSPVMLKMGESSKKFCCVECLSQFKQEYRTPQPCAMCCTPHAMTDMVENKNSEDQVELFCTNSCVMASKIQAVSASGRPLNCDNCGKSTVPACHLAMSDASIRNFCTLSCAMVFKETQTATVDSTGASDQTQSDFLKPPEKLPCAQCRRILKTAPKVVQKKGKMNFVCSLACSQEFKRVNNIMGKCEYCKNEKIIRDVKRVDGRDCYFCSDGCKMLFRHELEQEWGVHCSSCAYCMSISKTLVTAKYEGTDEKFCSEDCNSKYKMLFCHIAKCDTCGHEGKLRQSLPLLGEVKHFCDLKCVLHFCNKKVQMVNADSSPPRSAGTTESSPVIANVISLAGALAGQPSASVSSAQQTLFSVPDIQTKVVGHASVQTVPKELKNKSMLCTPLVHNKGVSCTPQTVDTEAQTDNFVPKVVVLPLPVPVYVPLPMNMYSQYTPKPVGLPLPLPVPVFLPGTADGADPAKATTQPDSPEEELDSKSEDEERAVTRKRQRKEHSSDRSDDSDVDQEDDSFSDSSFASLGPRNANEKPPLALEAGVPGELPPPATPGLVMREDLQRSPSPAQASPPLHHNENKMQHLSKAAEDETSQRDFSTAASREYHKLNSQCGIDAWKRWIQWRELQINLDLVSSHAVAVKEDILHCSAAELNDGLCCFIAEVKQPDGEPYSPDSLFYLCLSIQQYLFENGRMENIFSDLIYNKFSVGFTEILKGFRPSVTASGYSHSCVEEEFLWECKQLGAYSPTVLLNTLLFFCCKHFGFTTVEQHRQLSFTHIVHCTKTNRDNSETTFLRFYVPIAINEAESDVDGVPAKRRKKHESEYDILEMMENTENPLRCPVRLYEFYLSKCSESVKQRADLFYLQPDRCCVPSSPRWFSSTALDSSTMEAMLVRILAVRELQGEDGRGLDQQRLE